MTDDEFLDPERRHLGDATPGAIEKKRARLPAAARKKSEQHRRAKRIMIIVTLVCLAIGLVPAAEQLVRHGWHAFVDRAPGVGGTESVPDKPPLVSGVPAAPAAPPATSHQKPAAAGRPRASSSLRSASNGSSNHAINTRFVAAVKPARATGSPSRPLSGFLLTGVGSRYERS